MINDWLYQACTPGLKPATLASADPAPTNTSSSATFFHGPAGSPLADTKTPCSTDSSPTASIAGDSMIAHSLPSPPQVKLLRPMSVALMSPVGVTLLNVPGAPPEVDR